MRVLEAKKRELRRNIKTFINDPSFASFYKICYYCNTGRIETAPCFVAEAKMWRASLGEGRGCDACPLAILHGPYVNPFRDGRDCCCMIFHVLSLSTMIEYWEKNKGEIVLAFVRFSLGIKEMP